MCKLIFSASCLKPIYMRLLLKLLALAAPVAIFSFANPSIKQTQPPAKERKIQVAILLDVSGSMSGLIEQAKAQLWNMVNTLGKAQCTDNSVPKIELALYEYGRTNNDAGKGYVKQLTSFTNDLDSVSKILFGLNTNGGDEYCGQVIYSCLDELNWSNSPEDYKVIFISGNEDFLQGSLHYTKACAKAKDKGVIVNTIYCGSYERAIAEHWNLLGECGNGSFTNINHNAREVDIPTPYDTTLIVLNERLNKTYIGYGTLGFANTVRQGELDKAYYKMSNEAASKRVAAKAQSNVYNNAAWDIVDANKADSNFIVKMDKSSLPDSLKNKSTAELQQYIKQKTDERSGIQKEIALINNNRSKYITEQKARTTPNNKEATLETAVEKIIKEQVRRANMKID